MKDVLVTASGAFSIAVLLYIFYAAVRTNWPISYVSASADFGLVVNRNVLRYMAFMLAPAYLAALVVSTTVSRFGGSPMVCALVGAALHLARTQVPYYLKHVARIDNHTRFPAVLVVVAVVSGVLASAALGGLGSGPFTAVVPPVDEFFKSLWSTVLVGLLGIAILRASRQSNSMDGLVERSRTEVGEGLLYFARNEAVKAGANPVLVEGILLTENLQRPRWVRRLERWKGWFRPEGTYGVMQAYSDTPLTDHESVRAAIMDHIRHISITPNEWGRYDDDELRDALSEYNSNPQFIYVAQSIIGIIQCSGEDGSRVESGSEESNDDGSSKEDGIEERVALAIAVWSGMASRMASPQVGVIDIARLPLSDLRVMADIVGRLPNSANEELEQSARAMLKESDLEEGAEGSLSGAPVGRLQAE